MARDYKRNFTVIRNKELEEDLKPDIKTNTNYQTNPMYEKLLQFNAIQNKKRFTVEDLLKW